jgi:tetratricopeptide (TPR) repeat protein
VDPLLQSKYGARRFLLLNADARFTQELATLRARDNEIAARVISLAHKKEFGAALMLAGEVSANSLVALDAEFLTAVVQSQLQQGDREAALATLDRLNAVPAGMSEGAWLISLRCAQLYRDAGDSERARKSWSQAFDRVRNPGQLDALLAGSIKKGVLPDTERLLAYAEGRFAGNPLMLAPVAHARYTLGQFEETVRLCRTALEMGAVNARTLLVLGRALSRQGLAEEAAQVIASLRDLEPQNPRALEALIPLHFKLNNWDAAERDARELVRLAPTSPWGHSFLATTLKRKGLRQDALEHARRAVALDPGRETLRRQVEELAGPAPARARTR